MGVLINDDYSYNYSEFVGKNGTWKITGTKNGPRSTKPENCLDYFVCVDGKFKGKCMPDPKKRKDIYDMFVKGEIKAVESSKISASNKKTGRTI